MATDTINQLSALWIAQAAALDDEPKLEATLAIERWQTIQAALIALESSKLQSYTMGGNSYTRRDIPQMQQQCEMLRDEIRSYVSGGSSRLVDNRFSNDSFRGSL